MPADRILDRLRDILNAIDAIQRYTDGRSYASFKADRLVVDAVERSIERLPEASRHIPEAMKLEHPGIQWRAVADVGNVLRHAYNQVLDEETWVIVSQDAEPSKIAVLALIAKLEEH